MLRLAQRIYNLLDEIKAQSEEKNYILVAHNGIARSGAVLFYGYDQRGFCGVWREELRGCAV